MKQPAAVERYLIVAVGARFLALPVHAVVRVAPRVAATPLLTAMPGIEGLIRFSERVVAVLDLRSLLDLPPARAQLGDRLVLIQTDAQTMAVHVDVAAGVVEILAATGEAERQELLTRECLGQRVMTATDGVVQVLDLKRLTELARLAQEASALAPSGGA
jgi:chemotaxis signal transduction protein